MPPPEAPPTSWANNAPGGAVPALGLRNRPPARRSSPAARLPAGEGRDFERSRVFRSRAAPPRPASLTQAPRFLSTLAEKNSNLQAGGRDGSHKERRADPGGEGAAGSHRKRYGCWAATEAPPARPAGVAEPGPSWPRAAVLRGPGNSVSPFHVWRVVGAERWGGASAAGTGAEVAEARPRRQLWERRTRRAPAP